MASTQPLDLITQAYENIGVAAVGEALDAALANRGLDMLNNMLDQWSNDRLLVYCQQEVIHNITPNDFIYTIGPGGNVGATFTGIIVGDTLTVTGISAGAISVGQILTGTGITTGTAITSLGTAVGGSGTGALGTYKVSISQTVPPGVTTGSVVAVNISNPGTNYTSPPTVSFSGGGGAAATATLRALTAAVNTFGGGYTAGDILTVVGGTFTTPARFLVNTSGGLVNVSVLDGGNYSVRPANPVSFTGGTGAGGLMDLIYGVNLVTVTLGGSGYSSPPTVSFSGGGGTAAAATSVLAGGVGSAITITSSAPRPLRINSAFVRINSTGGTLDYQIKILHVEDYQLLGLKSLPGPWPTALYYQPSEPLGVLTYWPNPSQGEVHLFCDTIINRFSSLYETIVLPQGYFMAMMWSLAELLIPGNPATGAAMETRALIPQYAANGRGLLKRTNMHPQQLMRCDPALSPRRGRDAGWYLDGGFGR